MRAMNDAKSTLGLTAFVVFLAGLTLMNWAAAQEPEKLLPPTQTTELFDGESLRGWLFFCNDDSVNVDQVWSAGEGVLKTTGRPVSYLQTRRWYRDYELNLEWRWPGERGGNSGVLIHTTTPLLFYGWPKSLEVQLQSGSAGDFWVIGEGVDVRVENEEQRRVPPKPGDQHSHRRIRRLNNDVEKPIGEWNHMRIVCDGDTIRVWVNEQLVNSGTQCTVTEGAIALQAEGTAIEFRNLTIGPISSDE